MRTAKVAFVVALGLLGIGCKPNNLEAEKAAWERYFQQAVATTSKMRECVEPVGGNEIERRLERARTDCDFHLKAALLDARNTDSTEMRLRAVSIAEDQPVCKYARELRTLWDEKVSESTPCYAAEAEEQETRKAEYLAACQKCTAKGFCEVHLEHNEMVARIRGSRRDTNPGPERFIVIDDRPDSLNRLSFGCEK